MLADYLIKRAVQLQALRQLAAELEAELTTKHGIPPETLRDILAKVMPGVAGATPTNVTQGEGVSHE